MISNVWKTVIIASLTCAGAAGALYWKGAHRPVRAVSNAVIVVDSSDSTLSESSSIMGLADVFLARPNLINGSTLTVLTTGDDESAGEPRLLSSYPVPFSRRALEGKGAIAKRKREILEDLGTKLKNIRRTNRSPIFVAVKRGVEALRAGGCRADSMCYLFVRTDGEELAEGAIRTAIAGTGKLKAFSASVSNEGIDVVLCGFAETNTVVRGADAKPVIHSAGHNDRLRDVWRSVFTVPDKVTISPYCPRLHADGLAKPTSLNSAENAAERGGAL